VVGWSEPDFQASVGCALIVRSVPDSLAVMVKLIRWAFREKVKTGSWNKSNLCAITIWTKVHRYLHAAVSVKGTCHVTKHQGGLCQPLSFAVFSIAKPFEGSKRFHSFFSVPNQAWKRHHRFQTKKSRETVWNAKLKWNSRSEECDKWWCCGGTHVVSLCNFCESATGNMINWRWWWRGGTFRECLDDGMGLFGS
jgi:hypothetical protein